MDCFRCGRRGNYDRVAVERSSGEILGSLCPDCEDGIFSRGSGPSTPSMAVCLLCGGDSDVLFPRWDAVVEDDDGAVEHEYTVSLDTPASCLACAVWTAGDSSERSGDRAATD